jgi:hypothetical protein
MEKQDKVLKKIKSVGNTGSGLNLGTKKNDECYTDMQDIINELSQWAELDKFRGKNIVCPCDWDITDDETIYSIKIEYKDPGVEVTGNSVYKAVKSVQYDLWQGEGDDTTVTTINLAEDEIEDFLRDKLTCNFIRTLTQNARAWGIKSITASGYNPATDKGVKFQDVDYSKYDLCVTNPPFSLYSEFMDAIVGNIDFIVLAPFMNRANPSIGLRLMLGTTFLGFSANTSAGYLALNFSNPTVDNAFHTKKVACDWITSFPEAQETRNAKKLNTGIKYEIYSQEYEELPNMVMKDGTHPIRVACDAIPDDYAGWMFSAPNVLATISFTEYEWYGTHFTGYFNKTNPAANPFIGKCSDYLLVKPGETKKTYFAGIVFRKKPVGEDTND